jgi:hypothetical protein
MRSVLRGKPELLGVTPRHTAAMVLLVRFLHEFDRPII